MAIFNTMFNRLPRSITALMITVIYGLLLALAMSYHELWRDEAQAWMITKASNSLLELFSNMQYEGHPPLWNIIMWPFTYFDDPEWIKVPHWLLAISTCYLIVRYAPFPQWLSIALVFSYFFFFEYGVISRDYQLGIFGLIGFLSFIPRAPERPWAAIIFLAIAISANIFSLLLSLPLALLLLLKVTSHIKVKGWQSRYTLFVSVSAIACFTLIIATVLFMVPPADEGFSSGWYWHFDPYRVKLLFARYGEVMLPIPEDKLGFWNNGILPETPIAYIGLAVLLIYIILLLPYPEHLGWYVLLLMSVVSFLQVKYIGFLRHSGHMYIAYILSIWLLIQAKQWKGIHVPLRIFISFIIVAQLYANMVAVVKDITYPFSGGKATAAFILNEGYQDKEIIAHPDFSTSAFTAYYGNEVYYPVIKGKGTFVIWSTIRAHDDFGAYLRNNMQKLQSHTDDYLIVTTYDLEGYNWLHLIYDSGRAIVGDERIYVYQAKK